MDHTARWGVGREQEGAGKVQGAAVNRREVWAHEVTFLFFSRVPRKHIVYIFFTSTTLLMKLTKACELMDLNQMLGRELF